MKPYKKALKKFDRRIAGWNQTIASLSKDPNYKGDPMKAFRRPGSMKLAS